MSPFVLPGRPATSLDGDRDNGDDTVARFNDCFSNIRRDHFWRKLLISLLTRKMATLVSQLWLMRRASDCHFNLGAGVSIIFKIRVFYKARFEGFEFFIRWPYAVFYKMQVVFYKSAHFMYL